MEWMYPVIGTESTSTAQYLQLDRLKNISCLFRILRCSRKPMKKKTEKITTQQLHEFIIIIIVLNTFCHRQYGWVNSLLLLLLVAFKLPPSRKIIMFSFYYLLRFVSTATCNKCFSPISSFFSLHNIFSISFSCFVCSLFGLRWTLTRSRLHVQSKGTSTISMRKEMLKQCLIFCHTILKNDFCVLRTEMAQPQLAYSHTTIKWDRTRQNTH